MSAEATVTPDLEQPVFETRNAIRRDARVPLVEALNRSLADSVDLQIQAKLAHWNVRGPTFMALHELFDDVNEKARRYSDLIAERIGQLGGLVEGNIQTMAARSGLDVYPTDHVNELEHVRRVATALSAFAAMGREVIETAAEADDPVTEDIFTEMTRSADQMLWFVEAHLQG